MGEDEGADQNSCLEKMADQNFCLAKMWHKDVRLYIDFKCIKQIKQPW